MARGLEGCAPGRPGVADPELIAGRYARRQAPQTALGALRNRSRWARRRGAMPTFRPRRGPRRPRQLPLVACGGPSPSGSPNGSPNPSASPSTGAFGPIDHATGPTDVLLRYDQGGGFVMPAFLATQAPIFTLYGDGTIIFRNPAAESPPAVGAVQPFNPFRIAKLSEEQIQALLERRPRRGRPRAPPARTTPTTVWPTRGPRSSRSTPAGCRRRSRSTRWASKARTPRTRSPEPPSRSWPSGWATSTTTAPFATQVYTPEAYRGVLMDGFPGDAGARPWPWKDPQPEAFVMPANPNAFQMATKVLTAAQVGALGIDPHEGGLQGLTLISPDGQAVFAVAAPVAPGRAGLGRWKVFSRPRRSVRRRSSRTASGAS